ncbi:MAG: hypothetical protein JWM44_4320 [Bacilli bacterium]|nr:hypothetical protein [Bacilli bacterium]
MKIWELDSERNGYFTLTLVNFERDYPIYLKDRFIGKPNTEWVELEATTYSKGKKSNTPYFTSGIPVFNDKAIQVLHDFIKGKVEILPLVYNEDKLYALNIINVLDCIDYMKAEVKKSRSGTITGFIKYAFKMDNVENEYIFKIPELLSTKIFVTDAFRNKVIENGLKGFKFIEVWDSEEDVAAKEEAHQQYLKHLEKIERDKGQEYPYIEAMHMVNAGKAIVSGKFKLQQDKTGNILLGNLQEDGTYAWIDPIAYPPIFHDMKWHIVEKSDI